MKDYAWCFNRVWCEVVIKYHDIFLRMQMHPHTLQVRNVASLRQSTRNTVANSKDKWAKENNEHVCVQVHMWVPKWI